MGKNTIYLGFQSKKHLHLVKYLKQKYDFMPVGFFGVPNRYKDFSIEKFKDIYKNAIIHNMSNIRKAKIDYSKIGSQIPVDKTILDKLSKHESNYLSWLNDTDGWNFSFRERRRYYLNLLNYWNTVINKNRIELYIGISWPHTSDYPLYLLCKYIYQIPVIFQMPIPLLDHGDGNTYLYSFADSMQDLSRPFIKEYNSKKDLEISDFVKKYIQNLQNKNGKIPKHINIYFDYLKSQEVSYIGTFKNIIKLIIQGTAFAESAHFFKKNKKLVESPKSRLNNLEVELFMLKKSLRNKKLKKYYMNLIKPIDKNKKYIYFAGPYQPEVLSNLCAGIFENIFLVLDIMSRCIPSDWLIYYKEHPNTFNPSDKGSLERSEEFYDKINSYNNVEIIDYNINTFELIDSSTAVCTIGGTVGFEAVVRDKPAFVFGSLWYQGCKSIFTINNFQDAKNSVKTILSGYKPDQNDILKYTESIFRSCIDSKQIGSHHHDQFLAPNKDSISQNSESVIEKYGDEIYKSLKKLYN